MRFRHSNTGATTVFAAGLLQLAASVSVLRTSQDTAAVGNFPWTSRVPAPVEISHGPVDVPVPVEISHGPVNVPVPAEISHGPVKVPVSAAVSCGPVNVPVSVVVFCGPVNVLVPAVISCGPVNMELPAEYSDYPEWLVNSLKAHDYSLLCLVFWPCRSLFALLRCP